MNNTDRGLKICIISPLFEPWLIGGAENYVSMVANCLSKDHNVSVITTQGPEPRSLSNSNRIMRIYEIKPLNVCSLYEIIKKSHSNRKWQKLIYHILDIWNLKVYLEVTDILNRVSPNIVHTNGIKGLSSSIFSAIRSLKIPHVHTLHDYELISRWVTLFRNGHIIDKFNKLDLIYMNIMRTISSQVSAVISPSRFVMDFHLHHGYFKRSDKHVIPNPSRPFTRSYTPSGGMREFICIGQLSEIKGFQIAIAAFKMVKERNSRLHIVGEGEYMRALREIAGSDERIIFHGYINQTSVEEIFNRSFFGIVPSIWYEPFGLVINEMMIRGIPVIASNIGGIPEIVKDGYNGFLVSPGNILSLRDSIEMVLSAEGLSRMKSNATMSATEFSLAEHCERVLEVYKKVCLTKRS
jgi:glycosyltransferase involved in cell wall biosynthesis